MAIVSNTYLKSKFETGDVPTQQDFVDLIDTTTDPNYSMWGYLYDQDAANTPYPTGVIPFEYSYGNAFVTGNTSYLTVPSGVSNVEVTAKISFAATTDDYADITGRILINDTDTVPEGIFTLVLANSNTAVVAPTMYWSTPPTGVNTGDTICVSYSWNGTPASNVWVGSGARAFLSAKSV